MASSEKIGTDTTATGSRRLEADLAARVDGEVRFDAGARGAYSTDGSNFRQVPVGVVLPRTVEAAARAVAVCREHGVPLLSRGGGTSLAGQCTNTAVVIDWSRYCNRLLDVDPAGRTCQLLATAGNLSYEHPEQPAAPRPAPPRPAAKAAALAGLAVTLAGAAAALWARARVGPPAGR